MEKERRQVYLDLTEILINCPSDQISETLEANKNIIDSGWLQMLDEAIASLTEQGNREGVEQVLAFRVYAAQLVALEQSKTLIPFWWEIWQTITQYPDDPQALYSLLQDNLDRLNDGFAEAMQASAIQVFQPTTPEQILVVIGAIANFSNLMIRFPQGSKANNLEIAIIGYEIALTYFEKKDFPVEWAVVNDGLGSAYQNRIRGDRSENLERAIACYNDALQVYTFEAFPNKWAEVQNNLATALWSRLEGERAENTERAIACLEKALEIHTREAFPESWAMAQNNLGIAYLNRIRGERSENLERAIACLRKTLQFYTQTARPQQWADTQKNLGTSYGLRIRGNPARNYERAIHYLTNALSVYQREDFPEKWAETQENLAVIYWSRIWGDKAENLERSISCYKSALQVYTALEFPQRWAETNTNLGVAYGERLRGERSHCFWLGRRGGQTKISHSLERSLSTHGFCLLASGRSR